MSPPIRLAPDGLDALAALIAARGAPAPLSPALAALVAARPTDQPLERLAAACARRQHLGAPASSTGRAPAARFARRQHRRWRVRQSDALPTEGRLIRAGRRAARHGLGWPGATPGELGAWLAFWATDDPGLRHDLLASLSLAAARQICAQPLAADQAQRAWR